jgi:hypothetical protein
MDARWEQRKRHHRSRKPYRKAIFFCIQIRSQISRDSNRVLGARRSRRRLAWWRARMCNLWKSLGSYVVLVLFPLAVSGGMTVPDEREIGLDWEQRSSRFGRVGSKADGRGRPSGHRGDRRIRDGKSDRNQARVARAGERQNLCSDTMLGISNLHYQGAKGHIYNTCIGRKYAGNPLIDRENTIYNIHLTSVTPWCIKYE